MGHYSKVGRPFLLASLLISSNVAFAAWQGHGLRNPRMGNKGANQAKAAQRAAQQQRAQQQRGQPPQAQRRAEAQQDRARADQPKSPVAQEQPRNRTAPDQPRTGQNPQGRPAANPQEQMRNLILSRIGLNSEQQQRMAKITSQHDEEVVAAGRKIRQAQRGLDEAIMNPQYNEAEINRRIEDLAQARADQVRLQQRMRAEIRKVLTPEQVMKFNEVQREMQKKIQEQRQIQMQQTSPDRSPSGDQSRTSQQPSLDMIDIFLAKAK